MSVVTTDIVQTKNQKMLNNGLKVCAMCIGPIYPISHYILQIDMPPVLSMLIIEYLQQEQPVESGSEDVMCGLCVEIWGDDSLPSR
jgi:hypothetical protein